MNANLLEKAKKALTKLTAREEPYATDQIAVFATINDVGYYDIYIACGTSRTSNPCILLSGNHSDIGSHAEAAADLLAESLGVLTERRWEKRYSQERE